MTGLARDQSLARNSELCFDDGGIEWQKTYRQKQSKSLRKRKTLPTDYLRFQSSLSSRSIRAFASRIRVLQPMIKA